jgi:hypothetical protein
MCHLSTLEELSIEELIEIKIPTVYGTSKQSQKITEEPACKGKVFSGPELQCASETENLAARKRVAIYSRVARFTAEKASEVWMGRTVSTIFLMPNMPIPAARKIGNLGSATADARSR